MQTSRSQADRGPNCTGSGLLLRDGGQCWLQPPAMLLGASLQCYDRMGLILAITTPLDLTVKLKEVDAPRALAQVTCYSTQTLILCMSMSSHSYFSRFPHTQGNQSASELQGALPNLDGFTRLHKPSNCSPGFYTSVKVSLPLARHPSAAIMHEKGKGLRLTISTDKHKDTPSPSGWAENTFLRCIFLKESLLSFENHYP